MPAWDFMSAEARREYAVAHRDVSAIDLARMIGAPLRDIEQLLAGEQLPEEREPHEAATDKLLRAIADEPPGQQIARAAELILANLSKPARNAIIDEATLRLRSPEELVVSILEHVGAARLFAAVLDD